MDETPLLTAICKASKSLKEQNINTDGMSVNLVFKTKVDLLRAAHALRAEIENVSGYPFDLCFTGTVYGIRWNLKAQEYRN